MNKRIIISESEKKRILSQHKSSVQNESELKKQSLSERELSKLVNRVLIQEQLQVPGLPEGMGECIGNLKSIDLKQQTKIAAGCKDMDVAKCSESVMSVGVELAAKVISNPSILINWGKETMEFAKCMSEKFEMDLPIENLESSKTSEMKEVSGCKSDSDCPTNMACYNGKCSVTTSLRAKKVKESDEIIYEIEMDEEDSTPRKRCRFYNNRGKCIWDIINPFKEEVEMDELDEEGPLNWLKHKWWGHWRKQDNAEQGFGWMEESEEMDEVNDFGKRKFNRRGDQREEEMDEGDDFGKRKFNRRGAQRK